MGDDTALPQESLPMQPEEVCVLDKLMAFLRSALPWYECEEAVDVGNAGASSEAASNEPGETIVFAVCGNWYDVPHKAAALARFAANYPAAELLLTGGREGRLTPAEAVQIGGEPLLLQRTLQTRFGIQPGRMVVYTGSLVTNHNLRAILHYAKQVNEFTQSMVRLFVIEEGFLVRREAAALSKQLHEDEAARAVVSACRFLAVGPASFEELSDLHGGRADIALALLLGEYDRLERYATAGTEVTQTFGTITRGAVLQGNALSSMDPELAASVVRLRAHHADNLLASGRHVLEKMPREELTKFAPH